MTAYYNEIEPYAADWLRNLIKAGHIAPGDVDTRSIEDVSPIDLVGYTQCHFFAGLGGWSYALRLAGWPDDRAVWTGSCPCQPFSAAGKGGGFADERHLWPAWFHLISECKPGVIFGEQVASKDGLAWYDLVHADLEAEDYAVAPFDLCAAGVEAPHIRQRLWFVGDSQSGGRSRIVVHANGVAALRNAEADAGSMEHAAGEQMGIPRRAREPRRTNARELEYTASNGRQQRRAEPSGRGIVRGRSESFWHGAEWIDCIDGKQRAIEPGTFPLAHGVSHRVEKLRAYGNAIVPQVAAEVIGAYMEIASTQGERREGKL